MRSAMILGRLKKKVEHARFTVPDGMRVYAIGDIHGRLDCFTKLLELINADNDARGQSSVHLVLLGDLIDRGPDSAGVVKLARKLANENDQVYLLKGNHEEVFVAAARGEPAAARTLIQLGGYSTLESYGISQQEADRGSFADLSKILLERIPRDDVRFLDAGREMMVFGNYVFVHAGIRPSKALDRQAEADLRWIREPFLSTERKDGLMVVHGHTPKAEIDARVDRIGIDTGAFDSGVLTAIGLEGGARWFLQTPTTSGAAPTG